MFIYVLEFDWIVVYIKFYSLFLNVWVQLYESFWIEWVKKSFWIVWWRNWIECVLSYLWVRSNVYLRVLCDTWINTKGNEWTKTLARQNRVRGGHRASTTHTLMKVDEILGEIDNDIPRLRQLEQLLWDTVDTLRMLDKEILEKTPNEDLDEEI